MSSFNESRVVKWRHPVIGCSGGKKQRCILKLFANDTTDVAYFTLCYPNGEEKELFYFDLNDDVSPIIKLLMELRRQGFGNLGTLDDKVENFREEKARSLLLELKEMADDFKTLSNDIERALEEMDE